MCLKRFKNFNIILLALFFLTSNFISCSKDKDFASMSKKSMQKDNFELAIEHAKKLIDQDSNKEEGYILRAVASEKLGLYEQEISDYSKIIELRKGTNKKLNRLYFKRFEAFAALEQYEKALNDINLAIKLNNSDPDPSQNLSVLYIYKAIVLEELNRTNEAKNTYKIAMKTPGVLAVNSLCNYSTDILMTQAILSEPEYTYRLNFDYKDRSNGYYLFGIISGFEKDYSKITVHIVNSNDEILENLGDIEGKKWIIEIDEKESLIDAKTKNCDGNMKDFVVKGRKIKFSMIEGLHGGTINNGRWHLTYAEAVR